MKALIAQIESYKVFMPANIDENFRWRSTSLWGKFVCVRRLTIGDDVVNHLIRHMTVTVGHVGGYKYAYLSASTIYLPQCLFYQ